MALAVTMASIDAILASQLIVAWAGEGRCVPPRLGWWQTDLVDPAGGGDFFARLLPRTHEWASLEAVREVARRTDQQARQGMAGSDLVRTMFFLGFDLDERVAERLAELKRSNKRPADALPLAVPLDAAFSAKSLGEALSGSGRVPTYDLVPGGRQLKGAIPDVPELLVRNLATALLPFPERYPMPFYRVKL
jgi:hypothetical protein